LQLAESRSKFELSRKAKCRAVQIRLVILKTTAIQIFIVSDLLDKFPQTALHGRAHLS